MTDPEKHEYKSISNWVMAIVIIVAALSLVCGGLVLAEDASASTRCFKPLVGVTVKGVGADKEQRQMIDRVLSVGESMGADNRVQRSAIAAITQESEARNLSYGHGTSVGLFQIISSWGSYLERHTPEWAARWYYVRAIAYRQANRGVSSASIAQMVERSGRPLLYRNHVLEASRTFAKWKTLCR